MKVHYFLHKIKQDWTISNNPWRGIQKNIQEEIHIFHYPD